MSEQSSHKHHHHHEDYASRFKRRSLLSIAIRRKVEKYLKIVLFILSVIMIALVAVVYSMG